MAAYFPLLQSTLQKATRLANALPAADDIAFHKSFDRTLARELESTSQRLLSLAGRLVDLVSDDRKEGLAKSRFSTTTSAREKAVAEARKRRKLVDEDDAINEFDSQVQESLDALLEQADTNLDIVTGRRKAAAIVVKERPQPVQSSSSGAAAGALDPSLLFADIPKPQLDFDPPVDNSLERESWRPTIPHKHHAMVPLDYVPTPSTSRAASPALTEESSPAPPTRKDGLTHPYIYETKHIHYPSSLFSQAEPVPPLSLASTPFTFVETPAQLAAMTAKLTAAKEIAVDLEHHSFRSYTGFLCLMQISTRDEDFVIDAIKLRKELRDDKLGGVMADPSVIKVFHGADSDIVWLQQDFDIYVVGLFDTYHATKVLHFVQHSLASLLKLYCDYEADKRYQMADWRIRPVPDAMMQYARSDTHFLLYIYDKLRNALLERSNGSQDLIREVLLRSASTATKLHESSGYDFAAGYGVSGWRSMLKKRFGTKSSAASKELYGSAGDMAVWGSGLIAHQRERVFKRLHQWRELVARREDESTVFVMYPSVMWQIVFRPFQSVDEIRSLMRAGSFGHRHAGEIHGVVQDALKEGQANYDAALAATASASTSAIDEGQAELWQPSGLSIGTVADKLFDASSVSRPVASGMFGQALPRSARDTAPESVIAGVMARLEAPVEREETAEEEDQAEDVEMKADVAAPATPPAPVTEPTSSKRKELSDAVDTEIVSVARRKKAKKVNANGSQAARKAQVKLEDVPAFDYAAEPNQLDTFAAEDRAAAAAEKAARKKDKKAKKGGKARKLQRAREGNLVAYSLAAIVDLSGFRKPPSNPSEIASGNKSRTF